MSLPAYPEYKETNLERIDSIPTHWKLVPCRAIVDECIEKNTNGENQNYLSLMANVGVIRYEDKGDVGNKKPDDLAKCKVVRPGNLVINSMNYGIGSYGLSPYSGVCSPVYIVLNPLKDVVDKRYALRVFEDKQFQAWAQSFGNGILAHRSAIGWDDLKNIKVALPPLVEQKVLSRFLDHETAKIDALIHEQERLIELLQEKRQAVISHAVTKGLDPDVPMKDSGVEWLGEVPVHWHVLQLGKQIQLQRGVDITKDDQREGQIPVVSSGGISSYHDTAICEGPGVVVGRKGTAGKVYFVEPDYWPHDTTLYVSEFRGNYPRYVYYKLLSMELETYDTGSANPTLNRNVIHPQKVAWPPPTEQGWISDFLDQLSGRMNELEIQSLRSIKLLKERRSALISAAVTGKIDVRSWEPPADESAFDEEVRKAGLEETE